MKYNNLPEPHIFVKADVQLQVALQNEQIDELKEEISTLKKTNTHLEV